MGKWVGRGGRRFADRPRSVRERFANANRRSGRACELKSPAAPIGSAIDGEAKGSPRSHLAQGIGLYELRPAGPRMREPRAGEKGTEDAGK